MSTENFYRIKRSCIHNVRITRATAGSRADIPECLVLPREMMRLADIAPFEQINVTKIGGSNWVNRMYTFALPGDTDQVEARGSIAHMLAEGELCCIITTTSMNSAQHKKHVAGKYAPAIIDVRLYPHEPLTNDLSRAKIVLERNGGFDRVGGITRELVEERNELPRTYLSNLLSG